MSRGRHGAPWEVTRSEDILGTGVGQESPHSPPTCERQIITRGRPGASAWRTAGPEPRDGWGGRAVQSSRGRGQGRPLGPVSGPAAGTRARLSALSSQPASHHATGGTSNCCHLRVACGEREGVVGRSGEGGEEGGGAAGEGRTGCLELSLLGRKERDPRGLSCSSSTPWGTRAPSHQGPPAQGHTAHRGESPPTPVRLVLAFPPAQGARGAQGARPPPSAVGPHPHPTPHCAQPRTHSYSWPRGTHTPPPAGAVSAQRVPSRATAGPTSPSDMRTLGTSCRRPLHPPPASSVQ